MTEFKDGDRVLFNIPAVVISVDGYGKDVVSILTSSNSYIEVDSKYLTLDPEYPQNAPDEAVIPF